MAISGDLKKSIRKSGLGLTELARESGVSRGTLNRFLKARGDYDVGLENVGDKLADFFGLKLVHDGRTARPKPEPPSLAAQIRELLANSPDGLAREQIGKQFPGKDKRGYLLAEHALAAMKAVGLVRMAKHTGVYKLGRKPLGPGGRALK